MAEFQHRWFSLLLALRSHDEIMQSRFPYRLLTLHGCSLNWEIHLLIACLLYYLEEKPFCGKKNSLCGSIHHYMTEGRGAECTMWDSILSPRQLLFTPGAFSFFVQSVAAMLPCCSVSPVSLLLPRVTSSVCTSHGSPACAEVEGVEL